MALDFKSQIFQAFAPDAVVLRMAAASEADFTSTYLYERRVLKLLAVG